MSDWKDMGCGMYNTETKTCVQMKSKIGGLGGCPYAPGAKGNLSTVQLINAIGINSFIGALDLEKLLYAEKYLKSMLKN
jgi:hydroxymethylglutaryl-CoA lyase